ncbi:hypothetical protein Agabi119p4_4683 [Agaricus bisporus var. burnettii]|uniref:Nucleic acid-binding protein n=1 Tax=Agaricus bisporus var. burnettii TaxID=192524 RepID=A0A8H7F3V7_AGABI|nr:hypothetical protein Agabi119p4_4683 [Agaricus bisporus var. burnettii]
MLSALRVSKQSLASAARAFSTSRPRAADLAKLTLIGRIAKEPESRLTKNEKRFIAYTIVTSSGSTTVQGERQWIPTYHRVLCFDNSQLDYLGRLKKGSRVYVQADYNIKEPEQGADPTTPQGQRHIFLTHDTLKVLTAPRPTDAEQTERAEQEEEDTSHLSQDRVF